MLFRSWVGLLWVGLLWVGLSVELRQIELSWAVELQQNGACLECLVPCKMVQWQDQSHLQRGLALLLGTFVELLLPPLLVAQ